MVAVRMPFPGGLRARVMRWRSFYLIANNFRKVISGGFIQAAAWGRG